MIILPQLINEKVEFYYYRQRWLEKIKIMNEQYIKHVKIVDHTAYTTWLAWNTTQIFESERWAAHQIFFIRYIKTTDPSLRHKRTILKFTVPAWMDSRLLSIPLNYYYSSGLNDPNGYK
jgi:hypothetical protein